MTAVALRSRPLAIAERVPIVAVAGNPNAGKSTLFNTLTGLAQAVGNFPGTTVARREGLATRGDRAVRLIDLPGTYSLSAGSHAALDERIAQEAVTGGEPHAILNVVDATNLERNLYLTIQLIETGLPVVVALNLTNEAQAHGIWIDTARLQQGLGQRPIVEINARNGAGTAALIEVLQAVAATPHVAAPIVEYQPEIEAALQTLGARVQPLMPTIAPRWLALQLLEQDSAWIERTARLTGGDALVAQARALATEISALYGDEIDILTADRRYELIGHIAQQAIVRSNARRRRLTEHIDKVVTHRLIGLPLFAAVMYLVFKLVIDVVTPVLDAMDQLLAGPISGGITALLAAVNAPAWIYSLALDGLLAGVGGVLVFVPGLLVLYFFLALLEDSGYLARAAFVMDRLVRIIGLPGKAVIPLVLGFGCAVPAVYATRTIAGRRDRLLTALLIPLMSCSARLPVYVVFGLAFFGTRAGTLIWLLYFGGLLVAIGVGLIFARTVLRPNGTSAFVLELPPYRLPAPRTLWLHMWGNTQAFLQSAGSVILGMSLLLWLLLHLPWGVQDLRYSLFGHASAAVAPLFAPLGFDSWQATGALLMGVSAKEVVVSTLAQVYATGGDSAALRPALQAAFTPAAALAYLVFVLLYVPCISTIAAIRHEFGARWAAVSAGYQTVVAWLLALVVFQIGRWVGFG